MRIFVAFLKMVFMVTENRWLSSLASLIALIVCLMNGHFGWAIFFSIAFVFFVALRFFELYNFYKFYKQQKKNEDEKEKMFPFSKN